MSRPHSKHTACILGDITEASAFKTALLPSPRSDADLRSTPTAQEVHVFPLDHSNYSRIGIPRSQKNPNKQFMGQLGVHGGPELPVAECTRDLR